MEKQDIYIIALILFMFIGQVYIAQKVIFGDDYLFATFAKEKIFFYYENAHPPLPVWIDIILTTLVGISERTMRLTSIIFATATIALVYIITKKTLTPRIACIAAVITALSAWHIRASQMNSTSDGGMFTFFFYLTLYLVLLYLEKDSWKYLIATGISAGLTLLTRETGVLLFPILIVYLFMHNYTKPIKYVKICSIIFISSILIFSIYPLIDITFNNGNMLHTLFERVDTALIKERQTYTPLLLFTNSVFKIIVWLTPILLLLPIMRFKKQNMNNVWIITITVVTLFYFTVTPSSLDRARYLMVLIPALAICSAEVIDWLTSTFQKKHWIAIIIISISSAIVLSMLNTPHVISYESKQNPLVQLKQMNTNFSIPIFTETDNSGFLLNFRIILWTYLSTGLLFIFIVLCKENRWKTIAVILFLSISIGYNFILAEEYAFHLTSPNYSDAIKELVIYGQQHELKQPLYLLKNYELQYYLGDNYTDFISRYGLSETNPKKIAQFQQEIQTTGGTIIFTDMPPIDREGLLWKAINTCTKNLTIRDKGIEIGYVFTC